jgi:hypothetical protein
MDQEMIASITHYRADRHCGRQTKAAAKMLLIGGNLLGNH